MKNKPPLAIKKMEPQRSELTALLEHFQNKQYDEAERLALGLTDKFKTHPFGWKVLGAVFNKTGRLSEGLIACQKSVELDPENAENHNNLANIFHKLDRLKEAEKSYRLAISLQPNFALAYLNLGVVLKELNRLDESEGAFRHEIILNSEQSTTSNKKTASPNILFNKPSPVEYPNLYRKGMGTENIGGFLRSMAHMLRPNRILEVGAGYTTPFLLEALVNNERVYDDGNLQISYFKNYNYDPKLIVVDDMSLGELLQKPGMKDIINSKYVNFIEGKFEDKADMLLKKFGNFDFVWFDCGGPKEYETFIKEYWKICSGYVFFHFTYRDGNPNTIHDIILDNIPENAYIFDIVEPHKTRQGSITMVKKNDHV